MSSKIQYNAQGLPLSAHLVGSNFVVSGSGDFNDGPKSKPTSVTPSTLEATAGSYKWVPWGPGNNYPVEAAREFRMNGVATRALKLKTEMLYGKQIVTCKVTGFDQDAKKEVVEIVSDKRVNEFLRRSNIDVFRNRCIADFVWWGMVFPLFHLNDSRSEISMVTHDKAAKFRFEPFNESLGRIDNVHRSANWPNPSDTQIDSFPCIDSYLYYLEVDRVRYEKNKWKYCFPIQSYDILNDYYAETIQNAILKNGWLGNSNSIPAIVKSMIKNVMSIKYHIEIPMSYWEGAYPGFMKKSEEDRSALVTTKLQEINDFLSGKDNQMKAFISHYMVDKQTGKEAAGWKITALEDKMKYDSWTGVDTTALSHILFSIGINPALFGLGDPAGGNHQNGGSNIREGWLQLIASAQGDRDTLYSWWPFVREYNKYDPEIQLRTIDQVLTTLDQGKGTSKDLS
ncbi:hypothetical protein [Mucilaginibacter sp.]|uniref:hypothetical protein n=1 Tax=Mucilaginibacter sp. TaxID=1882438 RepID=UPI0035BC493E